LEIASIQKIRDLMKREKTIGDAVGEINHFAYKLSEEGPRPSFVGSFIKPIITRVLHRGSPRTPGILSRLAAPKILSGELGVDNDASGRARRAEFAEWMVDEKNPLTARVMANRIWQHVFGAGLVVTGGDFGERVLLQVILNYLTG
jgi:hypothetical protein